MNILITLNDTYAMPSFVMIESLLEHNNSDITLFVMFQSLNEANIKQFEMLEKKHKGCEVKLLRIDTTRFSDSYTSIHITREAYFRLLAQYYIPDWVKRCLYLDPDIIVNRNLEQFYNSDFESCYYIVCEGPGVSGKDYSVYDTLSIPHKEKYFNSGVMLMNLEILRHEVQEEKIIDYITRMGEKLRYHDQDVLNGLYWSRVKYADWHIYNQTILHIRNRNEAKQRLKNAAIIHYAGSDKPWKYNYCSWYFALFWKYALKAGFLYEYICTIKKRILWHIKNFLEIA